MNRDKPQSRLRFWRDLYARSRSLLAKLRRASANPNYRQIIDIAIHTLSTTSDFLSLKEAPELAVDGRKQSQLLDQLMVALTPVQSPPAEEAAIEEVQRCLQDLRRVVGTAIIDPANENAAGYPARARRGDYVVVKTYFATDRNQSGDSDPAKMFGVGRSVLSYGSCEVSIPRDHRMGALESPSILRIQLREDPTKHVVLLRCFTSSRARFFADVADRVREFDRCCAFLFVHGYNVTFEDAARRTAQISYDLAFQGAPVFYSWPSQGKTPAYTIDEQNMEWAQANIRDFLADFLESSGAQSVYLIGHSMGNRGLTRAVAALLKEKPVLRDRIQEVILTAPDIDSEVFKRDIAPAFAAAERPVTLYASSEDRALAASKKVHGYPRAGDSDKELVIVPGVETIDATGVDTSFLGHSYFAETRSVLSDMFYLIRMGHRPAVRFGLREVTTDVGRYWEFKQ